ncbi:MAG TPA: DUF4129 domain-containing protein [Terracidiphilus sp.]
MTNWSKACVLLAGCAWGAVLTPAQSAEASPEPPRVASRSVSIADYRAHLEALEKLTAACAKTRSAEACDPLHVGADDEIPWGAGSQQQTRVVRFGWLRVLLEKAQKPEDAQKAKGSQKADDDGEKEEAPSTSQLLNDARARLTQDIAQVDEGAGGQPSHAGERAALEQVLAGREFRNLKKPEQGPSALEKFGDWLNKFFEWLGGKRVRAAWVGRALIWGFLLLVGVGLAWALLQMERRWRVRLVPESDGPAPTAASARDWQLWLKDAREAAARGEWREAIHFLYWAAISRLESKKLWPADRARTPREYLALVAGDDARKPGLSALTREFEWTWYGGREAGERDYQRVEELATGLFESRGPR